MDGKPADGVAGVIAGGVALGVAELSAAAAGGQQASPLIAVGAAGITLAPEWLKDFAIRHFGTNDKLVLLIGLGAGIAAIAVILGIITRRHPVIGLAGLGALAVLGAVAAVTRPAAGWTAVIPSIVGGLAGMAALALLVRPHDHPRTGQAVGADRRNLLLTGAGAVAVAGASGLGGRLLLERGNVDAARRSVRLPRAASAARAVPAGAQIRVPGMTPFVTPNPGFYRVDTALTLPQVAPRDWTLRIHGLVDHPVELSFDDLLKRPMLERDITLSCVSNQVGGRYAGNARWLGASLAGLLREAGLRSGADQILSRSADGFTVSTPIETIMDGRDALLAVGMNGEPLPVAHGFPARMVVPGLYGYVSATKWVVDLKVTRFATDKAYWTERGYADHAPVKTLSRIDVPRAFAQVKAGRVPVAGTAWAQHRGIDAVEVRVDGGPWRRAELAPVSGLDTWRQWVLEWDATPGSHRLEVRATDGTGAIQPSTRVPPIPDGATGWHSIVVTVT
ncbi:molybdopterin-dependent oxidoreductase [Actinoallomurus sp. CA-142502]|uniref:molybdopterin-dependent oxidoreductase n=1 Tax=Actinoallomurus sp. CA-142502 TaxID=3239885 RepID=UPI003D8AF4B2